MTESSGSNRRKVDVLIRWGVLFTAILGGWLIWQWSEAITGVAEPWDAQGNYLRNSLLGLGFLLGLIGKPKDFWIWPIGLYGGQFLYCLYFTLYGNYGGASLFIPIGMIFLLFSTLPGFFSSGAGAIIRLGIRKLANWYEKQ